MSPRGNREGRPDRRPGRSAGRAWAAALVVALAAVLWGFSGRFAGGGPDAGEWAEVHREDLVLGVEATGTLSAVDSAQLGAPQLPELFSTKLTFVAPEGAEVSAGTVVLRFDTSELETQLLQMTAEYASAREQVEKKAASLAIAGRDSELRLAEAEARRRKSALKVDVPAELVAANELAQSRADLALAEREIAYQKERLDYTRRQGRAELAALAKRRDLAAARVGEIRAYIERLTVRAPRPGTVVYVVNRRGDKKKVGDIVWQNEKVIEIPDLQRMRAEAEVDEADAGRVQVGQPVTLRLDAHPEIAYSGRIQDIRRAVREKSSQTGQKAIGVSIALERTDPQRMRPGMRFRGLIEAERVRGALVVPAEAVETTAAGPLVRRRTVLGGTEEVRPRLGRHNGRLVEVLSGLAAGDRVAALAAPADAGPGGGR